MKLVNIILILAVAISVTLFLLLRKSGNPVCEESVRSDLPVSNRLIKAVVPAGGMMAIGKDADIPPVDSKDRAAARRGDSKDQASEKGGVSAEANVSPDTLKKLRDIFKSGFDAKVSDGHFLQELSCYPPATVLNAAGAVMKFGTSDEKKNALWAVGMLFSTETRHVVDAGAEAEAPRGGQEQIPVEVGSREKGEIPVLDTPEKQAAHSQSAVEEQAVQSCGVINTVSAGLEDADDEVRAAAFEVMRSLPSEEGSVLGSQVLSGKDADMKSQLLESVAGSRDADDIRLSLMGLGAAESSVRQIAVDNLKQVSGQTFSSQEEASEWFGAHQQEFQQDAGSVEIRAEQHENNTNKGIKP